MIYFDNAATTRPSERCIAELTRTDLYANPAAAHGFGLEAERAVTAAKKAVAGYLGVTADELLFTSGGTEGNNTAIGCYKAARLRGKGSRRIVTTKAEHPSVTAAVESLNKNAVDVLYLHVNTDGSIDRESLIESINDETALVSVAHVNNETGVIQPISELAKLVKGRNANTLFHCDAVQSFGKLPLDFLDIVDFATFSAHKIHGRKGFGALYVRKGSPFAPLIYGGGQQSGRRGGTEDAHGAAAFAAVTAECYDGMNKYAEYVSGIKGYLVERLSAMPNVVINGGAASPYILNASFGGVRGEVLLHALEAEGVYVSTGAACSSRQKTPQTLAAYGLPKERAESSIRLSFSRYNTLAEAEEFINILENVLSELKNHGGSGR